MRCSLAPLGANLMNWAPTRTTELKFHFHPKQRGLHSFISQLVIRQTNNFDGLIGFKGGSKSLSVLKTAARETYPGRRISSSHQLRSFLGLLKACYNSYFHTCLKFRTHHGYKCGTSIGSMVLHTLPAAAARPWLPRRLSGCG